MPPHVLPLMPQLARLRNPHGCRMINGVIAPSAASTAVLVVLNVDPSALRKTGQLRSARQMPARPKNEPRRQPTIVALSTIVANQTVVIRQKAVANKRTAAVSKLTTVHSVHV